MDTWHSILGYDLMLLLNKRHYMVSIVYVVPIVPYNRFYI